MRSMSGAENRLPYGEAHFMFLGEAPRNVREKRRGGEDNSARLIVSCARVFLAFLGGSHAAPSAFVRFG
jgi:hypothetical protein